LFFEEYVAIVLTYLLTICKYSYDEYQKLLWHYVNVLRWQPYGGHTVANLLPLSGSMSLTFRKAKKYSHTKCRPDISIYGRYITTSGCWKQTSAILKFYLRFQFWPLNRYQYVILHRPTKYLKISYRVMTSYRFIKMAVIPSQTYFRFRVWLRLTFLKVKNYLRTKCRPNISMHGWDITTSDS